MDDREKKIRVRAYEIWERQGRTGDPEDHWLEAEREVVAAEGSGGPIDVPSKATLEEAPPVQAVEALEATTGSPKAGSRRPS